MQRQAWPSELDRMTQIAGLRPRERVADGRETPFDAQSEAHVSVYGR